MLIPVGCMWLGQSSLPLLSDSLQNRSDLPAGKAEELVKYSACSELFSVTDQLKEVVDYNLWKIFIFYCSRFMNIV